MKQPWYERLQAFAQRKSVQIPLGIIMVIWLPFLIRGWIYTARQSNTWDVEQKMNAALQELQKGPPGLARAEKYLARLKAINTGYAPDDLKQALADYASALEQSIEAMKADHDTTPFDHRMNDAKQRMIAIEKRYE
jgi:4-amino-4-deoxy-L-arabinose transferase-like glycosyltransferase